MEAFGLKCKSYEFARQRPNLVGLLKANSKEAKTILISPHLDTVPAGRGWKFPPFKGVVKNGRIYGRGATDCKGNLAVAIEVLNSLIEDKARLKNNILFAATADEESGSTLGLIPLLKKNMLKADYALILDSDEFDVVITQKGLIHCKVSLFGRKAHGAYPWKGINAINIASNIIQDLKRYKFTPLETTGQPGKGKMPLTERAKNPIVIVVTNPVDLMTYLVSRLTGFDKKRVFGMGISLDAARFANLIRESLSIPVSTVEAMVMGSHGQTMVPLASLSKARGAPIERLINREIVAKLARATVERGASIVAHLGSGSAYFGPAAAVCNIIRAIVRDEKRIIGVCAYLNGEYGINGLHIGVPARIGKDGVEAVIELKLSKEEKEAFVKSCDSIRQQINTLAI